MRAGELYQLPCEVKNSGDAIFVSAPPHPVHISYRWGTRDSTPTDADIEGVRTALPQSLTPGATLKSRIEVQAPIEPGGYILSITLV